MGLKECGVALVIVWLGSAVVNNLAAYALSIFGGWVFVGGGLKVIRAKMKEQHNFFLDPLDFWLAVLSRAVATTLILYAPRYLAAFIGGLDRSKVCGELEATHWAEVWSAKF